MATESDRQHLTAFEDNVRSTPIGRPTTDDGEETAIVATEIEDGG